MLENITGGLIFAGYLLFASIFVLVALMLILFVLSVTVPSAGQLAKFILALLKGIFSFVFKNIKSALILLVIYIVICIFLVSNGGK